MRCEQAATVSRTTTAAGPVHGADGGGRTILVTGASSGIGRALALAFADAGDTVFGTVRCEADARSIVTQSDGRVTPLRLDVTDEGQIADAAARLEQLTNGRGLDVLINNAGIALPGPLESLPVDRLRAQLEVNVVGIVAVTQAMIPLLRAGMGRVVNIGSTSGRVTLPFNGPYSASKAALVALTRALRMELRPRGIDVSLIEAGNVRTAIWEKAADATNRHLDNDADVPAVYRESLRRGVELTNRMAGHAVAPEVVVRAVKRAVSDRAPRPTYVVGHDARLWRLASRLLPERWLEALLGRMLGL